MTSDKNMPVKGGFASSEKKILIIEDDNVLQNAIKIALTKAGFEVQQAFGGNDGVAKLKKDRPDLILLDLILPDRDGYHLLYELNEHKDFKDIPIVVLSAIGSQSSIEECMAGGAKDYLVKSEYSLDDVVKKVEKYLKN